MLAVENINLIERKKYHKDLDIIRKVRFLAPSQKASISPPIGPLLGQFGININDFCVKFNTVTMDFESDVLLIVNLILYRNKTFNFSIKSPNFSFLVNEENGMLASEYIPNFLLLSSFYKIIRFKRFFINQEECFLFNSILGSARSMHLTICNDLKL